MQREWNRTVSLASQRKNKKDGNEDWKYSSLGRKFWQHYHEFLEESNALAEEAVVDPADWIEPDIEWWLKKRSNKSKFSSGRGQTHKSELHFKNINLTSFAMSKQRRLEDTSMVNLDDVKMCKCKHCKD